MARVGADILQRIHAVAGPASGPQRPPAPVGAALEALSPPYRGQVWSLTAGDVCVSPEWDDSRRIEIHHSSSSSDQAIVKMRGKVCVVEARTSPLWTRVNGIAVAPGSTRILHDGDLMWFGEVLTRVRLNPADQPGMHLFSLGPFEAYVGTNKIADKLYKSQTVRHLLAYLASERRKPHSVDKVLRSLWPDSSPDLARKNLTWALSVLRHIINLSPNLERKEDGGDCFQRTRQTLQLRPEFVVWHDYLALHKALEQAQRYDRRGDGEAAVGFYRVSLDLYPGPYLEGCSMTWAAEARAKLDQTMLEAARRAVTLCHELKHPALVIYFGRRTLARDPGCQESCLRMMQADLELDRPQDALRRYEELVKVLRRGPDPEPSIEVLRQYQLALLRLG